jgi:hypothetical protein
MSTTSNVDGGDAVLAVGDMLAGYKPDGLRRAGDDERRGNATQTFVDAVMHIVSGGATVRNDVAPPASLLLPKVGDLFECITPPRAWITAGIVARVISVDADGDRWMRPEGDGFADFFATLNNLRNPNLYRPLPSAADRAAANPALIAAVLGSAPEDETADAFGPAGDEVISMTLPAAIAMQQDLLDQIRRLIPASRAYAASLESYAPYREVGEHMRRLANSIGYDAKIGG